MMSRKLRKGLAKYLLQNSIESVLTAVEIYNKPKTQFKVQSFIALMIIGWTKALHAYFHVNGVKYFYKNKDGKYELIDGEYKSWELKTCIKEYAKFESAVKANLHFFIKFRNKVEHRDLTDTDIEMITFGECQSLLYNYESFIITEFGEEYSVNQSLAFALQFSTSRTVEQQKSQKRQLSKELTDIKTFIDKYKQSLSDEVFSSQRYSVKFLIIPKISNTKRGDLSIDFVREDSLTYEDYNKITAVIKDKIITQEVANLGKLKPSQVVNKVNDSFLTQDFKLSSSYHHSVLCKYYAVKPVKKGEDPFNTNTKYCCYDEAHNDYVYTDAWVELLIENLKGNPKEKFENLKKEQANNGK